MRDEGASAHELIQDYFFLAQYGLLPNAGGMLDQPARFLEGVRLCGVEVARARGAQ